MSKLTVLPGLQRPLDKLVVGLIGGSDDDQLEVFVIQDVVQGIVDGSKDTEPVVKFPALGFWVPLQDCVQGEELWKTEDERHMKGETGQASS